MSMKLTAAQLRRLADSLDALGKVRVDVKTFEFDQHAVVVERSESSLRGEDPVLVVRGISSRVGGVPGFRESGTEGRSR